MHLGQIRAAYICHLFASSTGPEVIKLFSCSTQLSMKFKLLIKTKYLELKQFLALSLSDVVFIMLINVKISTIVGILTLMSIKHFMRSRVEHEKSIITITSGPSCSSHKSFTSQICLLTLFAKAKNSCENFRINNI